MKLSDWGMCSWYIRNICIKRERNNLSWETNRLPFLGFSHPLQCLNVWILIRCFAPFTVFKCLKTNKAFLRLRALVLVILKNYITIFSTTKYQNVATLMVSKPFFFSP